MEVIAKVDSDEYICKVSHTEIEKLLNLYYGHKDQLRIGEIINLGAGYDYYSKTKKILGDAQKLFEVNEDNINHMIELFKMNKSDS